MIILFDDKHTEYVNDGKNILVDQKGNVLDDFKRIDLSLPRLMQERDGRLISRLVF